MILRWMRIVSPLLLMFALIGCRPDQADAQQSSSQRAIQNKGSDTLVNVALAWAEAYGQIHPDIQIAVTGGGSGTGRGA